MAGIPQRVAHVSVDEFEATNKFDAPIMSQSFSLTIFRPYSLVMKL